jgi:TolB-like protein/Tfp pilus assembly protein PilF
MSFFAELKRRNVFRVGVAYILAGWVVLQAADFALDLVDAPNWVIQVFVIAAAAGLPLALVFAWAYEMTPEGIRREKEVDRSQSITQNTGRKLDRMIIGLLLLVIVLLGVERVFFAGERAADAEATAAAGVDTPKSIAVLPFTDMSQSQDQGWFADGLAEEILNALVKVPDLRVAARTSSFQYKGSTLAIGDIAAELGVAHVLEGSVRSTGDRIRVTAQLIRASDGFHLWSQNYDRDVDDMIGIQEDLAINIANALETSMDPEALAEMARVGTDSIEAYREYLRGIESFVESQTGSVGSDLFRQSYEHFEKARSIDPGFADAHFRAADYWRVELSPTRTDTGTSGLTAQESLRAYHERITAAITTAKSEADRVRSLANRAIIDLQLREAQRLYRQYLELRPNDEQARSELWAVLRWLSDDEAARELLDYLVKKSETDQFAASLYINFAYLVIDPSEAADVGMRILQRWPNASGLVYQAHRTLLWAGRFEEASPLAARFNTLVPEGSPLVSAREACAAGDRAAAEKILEQLENADNPNVSSLWIVHNMLGNTAEETEVLRPLEQSGVPYQLASFLTYHKFDPRPFPGLMAVLEREGVQRPEPAVPPFRCPPR